MKQFSLHVLQTGFDHPSMPPFGQFHSSVLIHQHKGSHFYWKYSRHQACDVGLGLLHGVYNHINVVNGTKWAEAGCWE